MKESCRDDTNLIDRLCRPYRTLQRGPPNLGFRAARSTLGYSDFAPAAQVIIDLQYLEPIPPSPFGLRRDKSAQEKIDD